MRITKNKDGGGYMLTTRRGINYAFKVQRPRYSWQYRHQSSFRHSLVWWSVWLPRWHDGRGKYVSIGLGFVSLFRGY